MSGVPQPLPVIIPFANDAADPAYITLPIPIDSQISVLPGAASFTDGFPPLTMSDPDTQGGIPPFGQDMNGLLRMLSEFCVMLQAGQLCEFDAEAAYAWGGYKAGALLRKVDGTGFWYNTLDGNDTDPDNYAESQNWIGWQPTGNAYVAAEPPAGTSHDYTAAGAITTSTGTLDLNPTGGNAIIDGFIVGAEGQQIVVTNVHASNSVTLNVLTGSAANQQLRGAANLTLLQNMSVMIQYSIGAGKWIVVP